MRTQVAIIGGGQAGLSMSWCLMAAGIDHVVLERKTAVHEWTDGRWETFCLVTPNWQCRLPGYEYDGDDPNGFMVGAELVAWLNSYIESFDPPIREHTAVQLLDEHPEGGFQLTVREGVKDAETIWADQVVIATGGYHIPRIPAVSQALPTRITQLHSSTYKSPDQFGDGEILVVGTGQSGSQIAEDLHLAGRAVHLAVGSAPRVARFYRGRDVVAWLQDIGHYDKTAAELGNDIRHDRTNHYVTGRDGGRDIDLRAFALQGMNLHGRLTEIDATTAYFGTDLGQHLDGADKTSEGIKDFIDNFIETNGIIAPTEARYVPVWIPPEGPTTLDVDTLAAVVWATGFKRDDSWNRLPAFDGTGYPVHERGVSPVSGMYFLGLPWQHTWGSGRFAAIARDARYLTEQITASAGARPVALAGRG
jgi:putative flavoprotein involved in K+ transport